MQSGAHSLVCEASSVSKVDGKQQSKEHEPVVFLEMDADHNMEA